MDPTTIQPGNFFCWDANPWQSVFLSGLDQVWGLSDPTNHIGLGSLEYSLINEEEEKNVMKQNKNVFLDWQHPFLFVVKLFYFCWFIQEITSLPSVSEKNKMPGGIFFLKVAYFPFHHDHPETLRLDTGGWGVWGALGSSSRCPMPRPPCILAWDIILLGLK